MRTFKDSKGRPWTLDITVYAVRRVRAETEVDLYSLVDDKAAGLAKLVNDPVKLIDVLYCLVAGEAAVKNVSADDFGAAFSGDSLEAAADAFVGAIIDFFPNRQARESLQKLMAKSRSLASTILTRAEREIAELDVEKAAEELMQSWINAPASSASTPDRSRSVPLSA